MLRNIFLISISLLYTTAIKAQVTNPVFTAGTTLGYTFDLHGQHAPVEVTINNFKDTLNLNWRIRGLASGGYKITPMAWTNGNRLDFSQPVPGKAVVLPDNTTFLMLSKKAFHDLVNTHAYVYDNTTYTLSQAEVFQIGVQQLNVLHVITFTETTEIWIVNNPEMPFICRIKNNPLGIDVVLDKLK